MQMLNTSTASLVPPLKAAGLTSRPWCRNHSEHTQHQAQSTFVLGKEQCCEGAIMHGNTKKVATVYRKYYCTCMSACKLTATTVA